MLMREKCNKIYNATCKQEGYILMIKCDLSPGMFHKMTVQVVSQSDPYTHTDQDQN